MLRFVLILGMGLVWANVYEEYTIPSAVFEKFKNRINPKWKNLRLSDGIIFIHSATNQALYLELYTDYYKKKSIHFLINEIDENLISEIEFYNENESSRGPIPTQSKLKFFMTETERAPEINHKYFTTGQNFKIGDTKSQALKIFGEPLKTSDSGGRQILEWEYPGEFSEEGAEGNPKFAPGCFLYRHRIFFRKNRAYKIILEKEPP